jgi:hypothetical protein
MGEPCGAFEVPASADDSEAIELAIERDRQLESGDVQPISHEADGPFAWMRVEYHP